MKRKSSRESVTDEERKNRSKIWPYVEWEQGKARRREDEVSVLRVPVESGNAAGLRRVQSEPDSEGVGVYRKGGEGSLI